MLRHCDNFFMSKKLTRCLFDPNLTPSARKAEVGNKSVRLFFRLNDYSEGFIKAMISARFRLFASVGNVGSCRSFVSAIMARSTGTVKWTMLLCHVGLCISLDHYVYNLNSLM